ncbi:VWA domain-containing protein [Clostridium sp.]|uniref:VWA domain-containing protein n=1 Tax=Clostridium sp. TaxID=1506 RepID=UPI0025C4F42F|nr:VWA domain-containing protein [Clostridium sp.]
MELKKKFLSAMLVFLLILQCFPSNVYANTLEDKKDSVEAIDFTLFSASEDTALSINGSNANVNGDIHTNDSFVYHGSNININGTCQSVDKIKVTSSKSNITKKIEDSTIIQMPDYTEEIKSIASVDADIYKSNKKYTGNNIIMQNSVIVDGNINVNGSKSNINGYVIATKDISFNTSKTESRLEKGIVIASETGNITFNGSLVNLKGIIYAPKGTVTINSANFTLTGRIIADKIIYRGSSLNVMSSNDDYELINGLEIKEAPKLNIEKVDNGFKLNWNAVKNATKYSIMRKVDQGEYEVIYDTSQNSYIDISLNAQGIYAYKVVASNIKNESKESNEVFAYVSEMGNDILDIDKTYTDTDGDGLTDFLEINKYKTDINNPDTDGDGISDGNEVFKLFTDPAEKDTDKNGITDDKEDFDIDGINNIDEVTKNTDPWSNDSDLDELTDFQEIYSYNTDPNKEDTDGDELLDNNEILQGTNPLVADTDNNGIKDGDEIFNILTEINGKEKDINVEASVSMDLEGKNIDSVSISNVGEANPYLQSTIPGYIGAPYEFFAPMDFDSAKIQFNFNKELLSQKDFEPAIYYFNEETNLLELLPNQTADLVNCTVSTEVNHFSTYILLNKKSVDEFWAKEMKAPFEGDIENVELVIGFSIDSSGSMSWNDPTGLRIETAKEFVDKMDDNDKAAVIDFDSSAKVNCSLTTDKTVIKNAIDKIDDSGGTDLGAGVKAALEQLKTSTSKAKYIIMLTDGEGSYNHNLTQQAINQGVKIYTIGLGSSIDVNLLKNIAESTGGKYYHASTASDLSGIFEETSEETVDLTKDTDGDGLSDYHEKRGVRINTNWIKTEYDNPDTDGDGLKDGEELIYINKYFQMKTNPLSSDSDNDGINDKLDPEPMIYSITDRTLSLAAGLSYTNLNSSIGNTVGEKGERELKNFKIIEANDCGFLTFQEFFDKGLGSVTIKISRPGKKDAIIYALRGTEFNSDPLNDGITDLFLGLGVDTEQSHKAFIEYKKIAKEYSNADFFITGHSLGGRLVQDVLYEVYDANDGTLGLFKSNITEPIHSATFNALGYNKQQYFTNWLFKIGNVEKINSKLYNYYFNKDLVGEGLGNSLLFERLGTEVGEWTATDSNGNEIPTSSWLPYEFGKLHGIDLFYNQKGLIYPNCDIY